MQTSSHNKVFRRPDFQTILARTREARRFIQVLAGPRQTGKTTLARQVIDAVALPTHYASADDPTLRDRAWLDAQWEVGRQRVRSSGDPAGGALLMLDEVHKIPGWSEATKRLWDEDTASNTPLKVMLLGSAPLLIQSGLTESLAGRFELIRVTHWSYEEMREAFGYSLDQYIHFGGYPGAAPLVEDQNRWARYILDSLIETTVSRDILLLARVDKPALLRQLFQLGCDYSGQVVSYQKMLGQLQDAGNTTTLANYIALLTGAGLLTGLQKYSGAKVRQRGSSPKLLVLNTALVSATSGRAYEDARHDPDYWGRLVESAVGAHLVNGLSGTATDVLYWRDRNREIDFVLSRGSVMVAIEVGSGRRKDTVPGLDAFARAYQPQRKLIVGRGGLELEEFLLTPPQDWLEK
jgi:predicted AAA+ superfamily ATPase